MYDTLIAKWAKDAYYALLIDEKLPARKCHIYVKPHYHTANWTPNPQDRIILGADIVKKLPSDTDMEVEKAYITAYLHHELAHSIYTERDGEKIVKALQEYDIPFEVFNLFEDARIEYQMRKCIDDPFKWMTFEEVPHPQDPLELFWGFIQCENSPKHIKELIKNCHPELRSRFKQVSDFYHKAAISQSTLALIPLIGHWFAAFPQTRKLSKVMRLKLFAQEAKLIDKPDGFESLIMDLPELVGDIHLQIASGDYHYEAPKNVGTITDIQTLSRRKTNLLTEKVYAGGLAESPKGKRDSILSYVDEDDIENQDLKLINFNEVFDIKEAQYLSRHLLKIFMGKNRYDKTVIPSKKINIRNLILDKERIYKRKSAKKFKKKKVTLIVDLSSSMQKDLPFLRLFIYALNELTRLKKVSVTLLLSAVIGDEALNQKFTFPISQHVFRQIYAIYEAEGIVETMIDNLQVLQKSDFVWILTDGQFEAENMNKAIFNAHKIKTYGIYLGNGEHEDIMQKHFDKVVCENSIKKLSEVLVKMIRPSI